ncbi:hypothetical protein [Paracoccus aerodenitrificans]|uniref:hypothetical protein n=1 Tax=Paracoccus aerodenitrificans TaxID=3017781 RepID=UPI0022F05F1A|nr:hypothetical protein [Paracoccus aerodenitrificans]WBU63678.1 hypothetical protein PAE61_15285 [Paracoccus aerodenitrificans]
MTKSTFDHERSNSNGRMRSYVAQDRESGVHPAIETLHRRPRSRDSGENPKAREYARIERGHES